MKFQLVKMGFDFVLQWGIFDQWHFYHINIILIWKRIGATAVSSEGCTGWELSVYGPV